MHSFFFLPVQGSIRFLSSHGTWTAAGNVNGSINVLDLRTGDLTANWKMTLQVGTYRDKKKRMLFLYNCFIILFIVTWLKNGKSVGTLCYHCIYSRDVPILNFTDIPITDIS